ncbi:MAG: hypothetical protein H7237_04230 [Alkalinema sp. FL-bin-369]|nr:hypothetical protein [Leptolyngbyaceae cyanobacterium LF-bin-369]
MFSAEQVRELSIEVDRQLMAARGMPIADEKDAIDELRMLRLQLRVQNDAIVVATGEEAEGFLRKFARVARRDVCEEGGLLNQQWEKYQDLGRKDMLVVAGALGLTCLQSCERNVTSGEVSLSCTLELRLSLTPVHKYLMN